MTACSCVSILMNHFSILHPRTPKCCFVGLSMFFALFFWLLRGYLVAFGLLLSCVEHRLLLGGEDRASLPADRCLFFSLVHHQNMAQGYCCVFQEYGWIEVW